MCVTVCFVNLVRKKNICTLVSQKKALATGMEVLLSHYASFIKFTMLMMSYFVLSRPSSSPILRELFFERYRARAVILHDASRFEVCRIGD